MDHLAFYNAGCEPAPGRSKIKAFVRRQARRVLLPMSQRVVEILASLCHRLDVAEHEVRQLQHLRGSIDDLARRQDELAGKLPATLAFGWDYVAMVRRLAVLEEHVDALMAERERVAPGSSRDQAEIPTRAPLS